MQRYGIFGGTFNPPHTGHIYIAKEAMKKAALDKVVFLPCGNPYHKEKRGIAAAHHRFEMTKLAILDEPGFEICDIEVKSDEPGYTAVTLKRLKNIFPGEKLCFLVGGDSLLDMEGWYRPNEIFENAEIIVANRGGTDESAIFEKVREYREKYNAEITVINLSPVEISSSAIRKKINENQSVLEMLSPRVWEYIRKFNIYRDEI